MDKGLKAKSKFLSLVLRHRPEKIALQLDAQGWAQVDELLQKVNDNAQLLISHEELMQIVVSNDKQRFSLSADGKCIRANQGHSINIDLGLNPQIPPPQLYHGSAQQNLESILQQGLKPGSRQHVHLSMDVETARKVGQRHGKPLVFLVQSGEMQQQGFAFYLSVNGVWLTDYVPAKFIQPYA